MGFCYDTRGRLCCDRCSNSGNVRRYKCPFNYCGAIALCPTCAKSHKNFLSKHLHRQRGCEKSHNEYVARENWERDLLEAGEAVRCSALNFPPHGVHVLFRRLDGTFEGFYMASETYHSIPLLNPATPDDYRQHGTLTTAPGEFNFRCA